MPLLRCARRNYCTYKIQCSIRKKCLSQPFLKAAKIFGGVQKLAKFPQRFWHFPTSQHDMHDTRTEGYEAMGRYMGKRPEQFEKQARGHATWITDQCHTLISPAVASARQESHVFVLIQGKRVVLAHIGGF